MIILLPHYEDWYKRTDVLWEINKCTRYREICIIPLEELDKEGELKTPTPRRYMKIWNINMLKVHLKQFHEYNATPITKYRKRAKDVKWGIYSSVDLISESDLMPPRTLIPQSKQSLDEIKEFYEKLKAYQKAFADIRDKIRWGFDFPIDFDSKNFTRVKKECIRIAEWFKENKIPHSINFSGSKGFHVKIPWAMKVNGVLIYVLKNLCDVKEYPMLSRKLALMLKQELNLKYLDTSLYDKAQVIRTPYTLHQKTELICLPLSHDELRSFKKSHAKVKNNPNVRQRGLKFNNYNTLENLKSLLKRAREFDLEKIKKLR